jgi:hypothetical protein
MRQIDRRWCHRRHRRRCSSSSSSSCSCLFHFILHNSNLTPCPLALCCFAVPLGGVKGWGPVYPVKSSPLEDHPWAYALYIKRTALALMARSHSWMDVGLHKFDKRHLEKEESESPSCCVMHIELTDF